MPPHADRSPPPATRDKQDDWHVRVETCRIDLWRGQTSSMFFARAAESGDLRAVCEPSASFRWNRETPPEGDEARLAHYELSARLRADGWARTAQGDPWYATEFARSQLASPPAAPEEPPVAAAPAPARATPEPRPEPPVVDGQAARRGDPWRLVAVAGLLLALAVLAWALLR